MFFNKYWSWSFNYPYWCGYCYARIIASESSLSLSSRNPNEHMKARYHLVCATVPGFWQWGIQCLQNPFQYCARFKTTLLAIQRSVLVLVYNLQNLQVLPTEQQDLWRTLQHYLCLKLWGIIEGSSEQKKIIFLCLWIKIQLTKKFQCLA